MDKRQEKAMGEAYDKLYDLDSLFRYKYTDLLNKLEAEAKAEGYTFVLNQKSQKWKCKRVAE